MGLYESLRHMVYRKRKANKTTGNFVNEGFNLRQPIKDGISSHGEFGSRSRLRRFGKQVLEDKYLPLGHDKH